MCSNAESGIRAWDVEWSGTGVNVDDREWRRLAGQVRNGDCTPFLGAGACVPTLPTGKELSLTWADSYQYPFEDWSNLPEVMQYACVIERDPVTVKQRLVDELASMGTPDFSDPAEPHALLARYPISVYLTTNYDDYMTRALHREGKQPRAAVCPWYRGSNASAEMDLPVDYHPDSEEPLVYHFHGNFSDPASLVLAEQDYVEFLINLVMDRGMNDQRVVPLQVLPALTRHPLLFVGYNLRDWSFRTLFHGLVRAVADVQRRRHVSVQIAPLADEPEAGRNDRAQEYLTQYFQQQNISVFWGTAREFCTELAHWLEDT